jgi:glycosyltransferase involved in cell wall biosynthesis
MYCGNCFRDNALVSALRRMGHQTLMVPLYLPLTLDESDQSAGVPIFFGGVNVYLDHKLPFYRRLPGWMRRWLDAPSVLRWAAGKAARTRPDQAGDLALSMLRGEEGNQVRELAELSAWLKAQPQLPEVICLSNALLIGLARSFRTELQVPVVCMLQGEDSFLDALPETHRSEAWRVLAARAPDVDLFVGPSRYYTERMRQRLGLSPERVRVVHNGISLEGYPPAGSSTFHAQNRDVPVLGFFTRMCQQKGLDLLVDAYLLLRKRGRVPKLKLRVGGACGPSDEPFVATLRRKLEEAGCLGDADFQRNLGRTEKIEFYRSLSVLSVPALYGDAFGLYLLEAMAAGVPVIQPRHAAFPEIIEATGGGVVCDPTASALSAALEELLLNPARLQALGQAGQKAVREHFTVQRMAEGMLSAFQEAGRTAG